jgi:hypothetical protein
MIKPLVVFFIACFFLSGCRKDVGPAFEDFSINGFVQSCHMARPIRGARVEIEGISPGFFGVRKNVGSSVTNENGYFSIKPTKLDDVERYEIGVYPEGFNACGESITRDSVIKLGGAPLQLSANKPGFLKIFLQNINPHDSSDNIDVAGLGWNTCGLNMVSRVDWNPKNGYYDGVAGAKENSYILFQVPGDDSSRMSYKVTRQKQSSGLVFFNIYCPEGDTTKYILRY